MSSITNGLSQLLRCACLLAFIPTSVFANETAGLSAEKLEMAQQKAQSCATCHGENGIAVLDIAPNLAGQKSMYTAIQLKAYRSGERKNEMMNITAKMLTDDDIQLLADYYEALGQTAETDEKSGC